MDGTENKKTENAEKTEALTTRKQLTNKRSNACHYDASAL
jgi:hypothetical protein